MDFTSETIQKVLEIAKPELHTVTDVHGITAEFATKQLHQIIAKAPEVAEMVHVNTLQGFADLITAKLEKVDFPSDFIIHIQNENRVALLSRTTDQWGRRLALTSASPVEFRKFPFGQWTSQEEFTIGVAALFADTEDKAYVLSLASCLTNEATRQSEDDGFTQLATIKAGLAQKKSVTIKPRVALAPYRTFPEIEQPSSEFVFRARVQDGGAPQLMLVEADGGKWKIDAIAKIREALESFTLGIPIIA
jgi:hypothetical protein